MGAELVIALMFVVMAGYVCTKVERPGHLMVGLALLAATYTWARWRE